MFFQMCVLIGSDRTMPKREGCPNPKKNNFETKILSILIPKLMNFNIPFQIRNLQNSQIRKNKKCLSYRILDITVSSNFCYLTLSQKSKF